MRERIKLYFCTDLRQVYFLCTILHKKYATRFSINHLLLIYDDLSHSKMKNLLTSSQP